MSIQTDYKEQVDRICMQANMPDGKDVLEMAKTYAENTSGTTEKNRRIRKIRTSFIVAAACVSALGLTAVAAGAAGYGPLSSFLRDTAQDEVTADLVDEGYLFEINRSFTDGIYRADLVAVSGDEGNPQLIIDLYIDDAEIALLNDTVELGVYTLGEEQYENELDTYGWCDGTAYRDEQTENLYHAVVRGAPAWMCHGEKCVIDITAISRMDADGRFVTDRTHMETRITIPESVFKGVPNRFYNTDDPKNLLSAEGVDYHIVSADFSAYESDIKLCFDLGSDSETTLLDCDRMLFESLRLTVDGTVYSCKDDSFSSYCDDEGVCGVPNRCYVTPFFPAVKYNEAKNITVSLGDTSVTLKGEGALPNGSWDLKEHAEERPEEPRTEIDMSSMYPIGESFTDGIYRAELLGVGGDHSEPLVFIDLYIDDPEIVDCNDTVMLGVYTLGVEQYENELDHYGWSDAVAYRDEQTENLYHAAVSGASVWMCSNEEFVIDITAVTRQDASGEPFTDRTHMETRLTIPGNAFSETVLLEYDPEDAQNALAFNGNTYHVINAETGVSTAHIQLCYDSYSNNEGKMVSNDEILNESISLTVDGKTYLTKNGFFASSWCDTNGLCGVANRCYITEHFPAFSLDDAETITLTIGEASLTLKGEGAISSERTSVRAASPEELAEYNETAE